MMGVFEEVCDLPPAERPTRVEALCGGDGDLRAAVLALLAEDQRSSVFLDRTGGVDRLAADLVDEEVPERIGAYDILGVLGRGGMGVVYEARQAEPARTVALKTIHPWLVEPRMLERFGFEADALARLAHPGIPAIYEVGRDDGRLFLAMERVHGAPLTAWADGHGLRLRERLRLLAAVCDAVHHAHLRGLVHRDLKPANVLVTAEGQPKVLDFGLARALDPVARGAFEPGVAGTLGYMSPEQLRGDLDLDLRTDVYALGATLYELVARQPAVRLTGQSLEGAVAEALTVRPRPLREVAPGVPADVAAIVERALAVDPADRYPSAAELAADLRRWLGAEAVLAHRGGAAYRAGKLLRRRPVEVLLGAALTLSLVAGLGASTSSLRVAWAAQAEAQTEARKSKSVTAFLTDLLQQAHPRLAKGQAVTVEAAVRDAARRLDGGELDDQPAVEFALRDTIGQTLWALGARDEAKAQLAAMKRLYDAGAVGGGEEVAHLHEAMSEVALSDGRLEAALALSEEAEALERALHPDGVHAHVGDVLHNQGTVLRELGRLDEAADRFVGAIAVREAVGDPRQPGSTTLAGSYSWLALVRMDQGAREEARGHYERALAIDRAALGDDHPDVAVRLHHLASWHAAVGAPAEALGLLEEAARIRAATLPAGHWRLADQGILMAQVLLALGRLDEAEREILGAIRIFGDTYGAEDGRTRSAEGVLAEIRARRGGP
jgi:eukaryotic-like serine/threonine-protein kinase